MSAPTISRKPQVVLPKDPAACWIFQGAVTADGYGKKCVAGRHVTAQRWLWEQLFGPVPESMRVGTSCGERLCINPYHLVVRSHADAIRDGATAVLTPGDLAEIRRVLVEDRNVARADQLAGKFGCGRRCIQDVWRNGTWGRRRGAIPPPMATKQPQPRSKAGGQQAALSAAPGVNHA